MVVRWLGELPARPGPEMGLVEACWWSTAMELHGLCITFFNTWLTATPEEERLQEDLASTTLRACAWMGELRPAAGMRLLCSSALC